MAIEQVAPRIGVQCYYKAFDRDLERYGESAGWVILLHAWLCLAGSESYVRSHF